MELILNFVWALLSAVILGATLVSVRRGSIRLSTAAALFLALSICFILLPSISMSDDLLELNQASLPASGQSWRIATEVASEFSATLFALAAFLLLVFASKALADPNQLTAYRLRPLAGRLVRAQRLRPPPSAA